MNSARNSLIRYVNHENSRSANVSDLTRTISDLLIDYDKQAEQIERLKEFARSVIKEECWGYGMDGFETQDLAEKLGLIKEHIATEDDVDEFTDFEVGDKIYEFTDILKGPDNEE